MPKLKQAARAVSVAFDELQRSAGHGLIAVAGEDARQRLFAKVEYGNEVCVAADATCVDAAKHG